MALLNATDQAKILYGAGNPKISSRDIALYLKTPGLTAADIQAKAVEQGVSVDQISKAMAANPQYSTANINKYLGEQGINKGLLNTTQAVSTPPVAEVPKPVEYKAVETPKPVEFNPIVAPPPVEFRPAIAPPPVVSTPITIDAKDTVAGHLYDFTNNPNNPFNVQAVTAANQWANKRGLLDSTIGLSAAQDAVLRNAMPIAQQDAGTNFAAKQQNSQQGLQANTTNAQIAASMGISNSETGARVGVSNADRLANIGISSAEIGARTGVANNQLAGQIGLTNAERAATTGIANADFMSRIGMFNAGTAKDLAINQTNIDLNKYTANLDADTKLAVANVQALANETGLAGDLGKNLQSYMSGIFTSNMSPEKQKEAIKAGVDIYNDSMSFFTSIKRKAGDFTFESNAATPGAATEEAGSSAGGGVVTEFNIPKSDLNPLSYPVEPSVLGNVSAFEKATGTKLDRSRVAPESLVMDIKSWTGTGYPAQYITSDGQTRMPQRNGYDIPKLLEKTKSKNTDELFDKLFQGVPWPNSMRADPMFYIYK